MKSEYCPERGDLIWIDFNPQKGHEQKGRRPALVISPAKYNCKVGLAVLLPITRTIKNYPFKLALPEGSQVEGVIITDQIKSLDWRSRNAEFIDKLPEPLLRDAINMFSTLIKI